ncbi:hypothetical protein JHK82_049281 [Glycine max]|uniref:Peptidase A1 domain-containing protein n=2 Tax=Glycine subgen. Soja TaxID=1462606 RepID=I1MZB5_SOYBN|nr:hypothetical protein JHK87_048926 [Glycine soja]KAG4934974.1 hypothetical protein JHK85_049893 [Glycine max]KAG5090503.1 hypothetical protein JHK82_049281 [Glycine max]KAG5093587.1 hypothetical protein JHK84_049175 [Glycine max]KAH1153060.1 hypothetical protein GYH30_048934 [Glycine max]
MSSILLLLLLPPNPNHLFSLLFLPNPSHIPTPPSSTRKISFHHNVTLTVSLTVGTPPQSVTMVLHTSSELSGLHCKIHQNIHSIFTPHLHTMHVCHATVSYADATSLEGSLAAETFAMSGSGQPGIIFVCMDSGFSSNANEDSKITELMGMNRGSLSFVTQMGFPKFSYSISGKDASGVLLFGDATFKYTPLV